MVLRWLLVSAVARVMAPGCKVDTMVILEGRQGARKSSALRAMFGEWFSDTPIEVGSKDSYLSLRGRWCLEWAELDSLSRSEAARVKAYTSSATDVYRPPYGHRTVEIPRQCVFVGSTNEDEYLRDPTGARRFLPVRVGDIALELIERDRDQLWAEAVTAYRSGERWWPATELERSLCGDEQEQRYASDAWEALIAQWLSGRIGRHSVADVASGALALDAQRLGRASRRRKSG
jgi:putative DNA primase/helicase